MLFCVNVLQIVPNKLKALKPHMHAWILDFLSKYATEAALQYLLLFLQNHTIISRSRGQSFQSLPFTTQLPPPRVFFLGIELLERDTPPRYDYFIILALIN